MAEKQDTYNTQRQNSFSFTFISSGPNGHFPKMIVFELINSESSFYNLAFGDIIAGQMNDKFVSDNQDTWKILATVANEVEIFLENHPSAIVFAEGSTPSRTRLYHMGLTKYYNEIAKTYMVLGYRNEQWLPFEKGATYKAFLIFKKR